MAAQLRHYKLDALVICYESPACARQTLTQQTSYIVVIMNDKSSTRLMGAH